MLYLRGAGIEPGCCGGKLVCRVYHGLGTQFNGIVKGCLKQLSNRLSQKR